MVNFFQFLLDIGVLLISHLPELAFSFSEDVVENASVILCGIGYFLPIGSLFALFSVKMTVITFRMTLAVIKFIKSFFPGFF